MEAQADSLDQSARAGQLPPTCFHVTQTRAAALKRTKMFFGARCATLLQGRQLLLPPAASAPACTKIMHVH